MHVCIGDEGGISELLRRSKFINRSGRLLRLHDETGVETVATSRLVCCSFLTREAVMGRRMLGPTDDFMTQFHNVLHLDFYHKASAAPCDSAVCSFLQS